MKLMHSNHVLAQVVEARNLWSRTRGLMFRERWSPDQTLWIHRCNSIHTWFVRFPIDVVFVDKKLRIKKIIRDLKPWRFVAPVWSARSVFEFTSESNLTKGLQEGDQLNVGH